MSKGPGSMYQYLNEAIPSVLKAWYYKDGGCKVFVFAKKRSEQHILYSEIMENSKKL